MIPYRRKALDGVWHSSIYMEYNYSGNNNNLAVALTITITPTMAFYSTTAMQSDKVNESKISIANTITTSPQNSQDEPYFEQYYYSSYVQIKVPP